MEVTLASYQSSDVRYLHLAFLQFATTLREIFKVTTHCSYHEKPLHHSVLEPQFPHSKSKFPNVELISKHYVNMCFTGRLTSWSSCSHICSTVHDTKPAQDTHCMCVCSARTAEKAGNKSNLWKRNHHKETLPPLKVKLTYTWKKKTKKQTTHVWFLSSLERGGGWSNE